MAWKLRRNKWFGLSWANKLDSLDIEEPDGTVFMAINRWMKRRIERSRARCDRAETKKTDKLDQHKKADQPQINTDWNRSEV